MERSSCILPSNAPALHDSIIDDIGVPRPILQERCNNRQQDFLDGDHRKHGLYQPAENFYNSAAQGYLASSQSSHTGYAASTWLADEDERVRQEAARLWRMLSRSDAYRKYRARQPKDCREQDQKWPEHMELAFFSGRTTLLAAVPTNENYRGTDVFLHCSAGQVPANGPPQADA